MAAGGATIVVRRLTGQEPRHFLRRADRRRQPDALRGLVEQLVEPFQRQRQMRAALGACDGVHFVDDHRLNLGESVARSRGQHQEQRLRRGDEDVGRLGDQRAALAGGVSPERTPTLICGAGTPRRSATREIPVNGVRRLRSTSTASALSGDT